LYDIVADIERERALKVFNFFFLWEAPGMNQCLYSKICN
jgi:hypothetical protein